MMCSLTFLYSDDSAGDNPAEDGLFSRDKSQVDLAFEMDREIIEQLRKKGREPLEDRCRGAWL